MAASDALNLLRFALGLVLAPVVLGIASRIRIPAARTPFLVGFLCVLTGFGMAAAQPWWDTQLLRTSWHVVFGVGGLALALAAWRVRRSVLSGGSRG